jgi:putative ABC transport system permease protein
MARRRPLLTLAPWRRAPLLLARSPGVLAAVAGAGFLLALAVASRPVFLSSAASAAIASDLKDGCRYEVGLRVAAGRIRRAAEADQADVSAIPRRTALLNRATGGPGVEPTVITVTGGNAQAITPQGERGQGVIQLFSRTGASNHVAVRQGGGADGLWLPDTTAALLEVGAGDMVGLNLGATTVPIRVAAVFEDLTYQERPGFWCSMQRSFEPLGSNPLPPVALLEQQQLLDLLTAARRAPERVWWEIPPADGLSLPQAEAVSRRLQTVNFDLNNMGPLAEPFGMDDGLQVHFGLPGALDHAHLVARQVRTTADTVGAASTAIALVAVAAAGFFWVDRRRTEVALLLAKGVGPIGLAVKGALEAALPILLGAAGGVAAAVAAVRSFGPSATFDSVATAEAARLAAAAAAVGIALLAVAAGVRVARAENRMAGVPHQARGLLPVALAGLAGAAVATAIAIEHSTDSTRLGGTNSLGLIVVVFPLLVLVGGGGLFAALGHWLLPRTRQMGRSWPAAPYLAVRRVATAGPLALALTAGSVLSAGILLYASVVADSARATVVAKATIGVGSDLAVFLQTEDVPTLPPDLDRRATAVMRSATEVQDGNANVEVLGIDRATFARAAFYDRSFASGRSLPSVLRRLDGPARARNAGDPVPVVLADGAHLPDRFNIDNGGSPIPVRVVARTRAFPGMNGEQPLAVADEAALARHGLRGNRQLWIRGSVRSVTAQLDRAHVPVIATAEAKSNEAASSLLPLATSLGYFQALGLLGGTVTLCGAVFYLASRERARRLAGVMTKGMGLTRAASRRALVIELGGLLLLGLALGGALSSWAARVTFPHLDPSPGTPPPLIFRWSPTTLALAFLSERASSRRLAAEVVRAES